MSNDTPLPPRSGGAPKPKAAKPKKKGFRWGRFFTWLLALIVVGLAGAIAYVYYVPYQENLVKIAKPGPAVVIPKEERAQVKPVSLVLLGLDHRKQTGSMNTDVMMVAAFNPVSKTATVVSIPRDSDLQLDNYKRHKANGYYAAFYTNGKNKDGLDGEGASAYARDEMKLMMERFFGISVSYAAVLDFQGFIDVVDVLGGVRVNVDQDMRYVDNADGTNINLKKGEQELDGKNALDFVRYRQSNRGTKDSSDFARNERQSQVLGAITDRLKSFSGPTKVIGVMNAVGDNLRTDIPAEQIENIIKTYFGISRADIRFMPLTGTWRSPYVHLDETSLANAKRALAEEMRPEGRAASGASSPASASGEAAG